MEIAPELVAAVGSAVAAGAGMLFRRHLKMVDDTAARLADQERRFGEERAADRREFIAALTEVERSILMDQRELLDAIKSGNKELLSAIAGVERTVDARADEQASRTVTAVDAVKAAVQDRRFSDAFRAIRTGTTEQDPSKRK